MSTTSRLPKMGLSQGSLPPKRVAEDWAKGMYGAQGESSGKRSSLFDDAPDAGAVKLVVSVLITDLVSNNSTSVAFADFALDGSATSKKLKEYNPANFWVTAVNVLDTSFCGDLASRFAISVTDGSNPPKNMHSPMNYKSGNLAKVGGFSLGLLKRSKQSVLMCPPPFQDDTSTYWNITPEMLSSDVHDDINLDTGMRCKKFSKTSFFAKLLEWAYVQNKYAKDGKGAQDWAEFTQNKNNQTKGENGYTIDTSVYNMVCNIYREKMAEQSSLSYNLTSMTVTLNQPLQTLKGDPRLSESHFVVLEVCGVMSQKINLESKDAKSSFGIRDTPRRMRHDDEDEDDEDDEEEEEDDEE